MRSFLREMFIASVVAVFFVLMAVASRSEAQGLPVALSMMTVSWSIPTERENGNPLSIDQIAGYELYGSCLSEPLAILGGDNISHSVAVSTPYSCTFTVVTVDTDGLRSVISDPLTVVFNSPLAPIFNEITVN